MNDKSKILRVSGGSPVKETAGSIVKSYEEGSEVEIRAIGASAVNQAVKALATARSILAQKGLDASFRVGYGEQIINDEKKTIMIFRVEVR